MIEEGKYYKMRGGGKVGPMRRVIDRWSGIDSDRHIRSYNENGFSGHHDSPGIYDIIEEWADGPVRTVTRKEIVPGVYGCIHLGGVDAASRSRALVSMHSFAPLLPLKAHELRDAARIFTELADALDDGA